MYCQMELLGPSLMDITGYTQWAWKVGKREARAKRGIGFIVDEMVMVEKEDFTDVCEFGN